MAILPSTVVICLIMNTNHQDIAHAQTSTCTKKPEQINLFLIQLLNLTLKTKYSEHPVWMLNEEGRETFQGTLVKQIEVRFLM